MTAVELYREVPEIKSRLPRLFATGFQPRSRAFFLTSGILGSRLTKVIRLLDISLATPPP